MNFKEPDTSYWNDKFAAYMHDPLDKAFDIKGHEKRAKEILFKYGLQAPNDKFWKIADGIASGFERGQVPSYSQDKEKSGAVDFYENPIINHPVSSNASLKIELNSVNKDCVWDSLIEFISKEIGMKVEDGGYSNKWKGDETKFAMARFFYTHLVLRFKLAEENVGNLGALWHRLPADTRFPDHSIWQHNQLVSAIYSCMRLGKGDDEKRKNNIGLMVFSITPVQPFIAKARKLRDYWVGSVLLSYLAFEGIEWVIENLGPDHVVYPSLVDQPLIAEYLRKKWKVEDRFAPKLWEKQDKKIANFPNKFLFFAPFNMAEEIGEKIEEHIQTTWKKITDAVYEKVVNKANLKDEEKNYLKKLFDRQNKHYWDMQWACVRLIGKDDYDRMSKLLSENDYKNQFAVLDIFNEIIKDKQNYEKGGKGILYSTSHSLVQSTLAASKTKKHILRDEEPGEKCKMCGEFEVLHAREYKNDISAKNYSNNIKDFWKKIEELWKNSPDFKPNERLCSICLTKRIIHQSIDKNLSILRKVFKDYDSFPSTTMIALHDFYKEKGITDTEEKKKIAQKLYESKSDELKDVDNRDKYYAILMMDGDKMGDLINGKTIGSTWESIMHPDIVEKIKNNKLDEKYSKAWNKIFKDYPKRLITPSIHAAISEALGDFAIYGVSNIIKKYEGTLIYAGGDDVCAIMPVSNVLDAAFEIQRYYKSKFKLISSNNEVKDIESEFQPEVGKLSIGLGNGERKDDKINISAGILICHHKENLSDMIKRSHGLLDVKAKDEAGRGACAIELRKRNGGSRYFARKWNDTAWNSFKKVGKSIKGDKKVGISTSMVYRLELFRDGIEAILKSDNQDKDKMLAKFIKKQLERSQLPVDEKEMAKTVKEVCVNGEQFEPEGLIVAAFMYGGDKNA